MATADDILFEPIQILPAWLQRARQVDEYIRTFGPKHKPMATLYPMDRQRPNGSITLEQLMELCHVHGQSRFFLVVASKHTKMLESFPFSGTIDMLLYEHGYAPRLTSYYNRSIRDMNLVPNTYTRHFVFANEDDGRTYLNSL